MNIELFKRLDVLSTQELNARATSLIKDIPYQIQKISNFINSQGVFFRVKVSQNNWFEDEEDFYPHPKQYERLNRIGAPGKEPILFCSDDYYWNVIEELIDPTKHSRGKISVMIFQLNNADAHKVCLPFSREVADSWRKRDPILAGKIDILITYFTRLTNDKEYDYTVSSVLSREFLRDALSKHPNVIGLQYMPVNRRWLTKFGSSFNYAFLFNKIKDNIGRTHISHLEYSFDSDRSNFRYRDRGKYTWNDMPVRLCEA